MSDYSVEPFGKAVMRLLEAGDKYRKSSGTVNLSAFASEFEDHYSYEGFRRVIAGERPPSARLLELTAEALDINPLHFAEYRRLDAANRIMRLPSEEFDDFFAWLRDRSED